MVYNNTELSEIVCTKISHDLIGTIGALSASLELMSDNNGVLDEDTSGILNMAAQTLSARQKLFRIAFGQDTKNIDINELQDMCKNYLKTLGNPSYPILLSLNNVSSQLAKIISLCTIIGAEICIKGGKVEINVTSDNLTLKVHSEHSLYAAKAETYKQIATKQKLNENCAQYAALIYLLEFLGNDAKVNIVFSDTDLQMIIE